ncbi:MAG TPA: hypothetical protein VKB25_07150 [Conexibacter sp.]|nr:hypothetical protein [Conexibacter sp.]
MWIVALPCALVLLAAIVLLGPPLGRALFEPTGAEHIWPRYFSLNGVRPEPTEHARFVLALLGPVLVVGAGWLLRGRRLPTVVPAVAVVVTQVALVAFVVVCIVAQREHLYEIAFTGGRGSPHTIYFTNATLVVSAAIALVIAFALSRPAVVERIARVTRETPLRRAIAIGVAAAVTVAYLLSAYNTDGTINIAHAALWDHTAFYIDEAFSILNGQAPLVDFHAQYGHLWAYIAAGGLTLFGASLGVYAAIMLAGTAGTMAAVFATMRRLVGGSSLLTVALFLPFVATSFFMKLGPFDNRYSPASLFSLFPIRYAGPFVLLWLLVRRLDRQSTRRPLALLALAGLVVINNPEFGVPGVGATLLMLAWTLPDRSLRGLGRLALEALAGGVIAVALVSALTLAVGGGLPHFGMLLLYPRIFGTEGFGLLPMPSVGFHLVVYVTFVAAIAVAAVRGLAAGDRALSVALAWIGIFGLGVGAYFTGRSHPHVLVDLFSVWAYALVLLAIVAIRAVQRRPNRRPQLAELLVLAGLGVMACSLAQIPTPWSQLERIQDSQPHDVRVVTALEEAMRENTRPGEPVAVLVRPGHQISEEIGIRDITPYANIDSMMTEQQWAEMVAALQHAHGRQLFVQQETLFNEHVEWLAKRGYRPYAEWRTLALIAFARGRPPVGRDAPPPTRR